MRYPSNKKTLRRRSKQPTVIEADIADIFLETLLTIKLFHWKTESYAAHKASDEFYSSLNDNMDKFMEILFGKSGKRMNFDKGAVKVQDIKLTSDLVAYLQNFRTVLVNFSTIFADEADLLNIRDEILGDLNKFLYLLTFT
jgi:hypothetical protein